MQPGEIDVEHHHDEQEQNRDRADIDDDQDHRDELRADQHEQGRGVEERQDEEQHRVNGIARGHDHGCRRDRDGREDPKGYGLKQHVLPSPELGLAVRRVGLEIGGDLAFPAVAVREQLLLVVDQLFARLG